RFFAESEAMTDALSQHCTAGAEIAEQLELGGAVGEALGAHHEQWDGKGFPRALAGEAISIEARIIAAADVAESLIAEEISSLVARRRFASSISQYSGIQIDPALVTL